MFRLLFATRWFSSVVQPVYRQTEQGLVLVYKVKERPIVEKVEFRGYKKIKIKRLQATTGLKVGSPFDISANQESVHRIKQLYVERGYRFAEVKLLKGVETLTARSSLKSMRAPKSLFPVSSSAAINSSALVYLKPNCRRKKHFSAWDFWAGNMILLPLRTT